MPCMSLHMQSIQMVQNVSVLQKQLCGLVVPHEVQVQGAASLAALSALCMYLKRCHADKELATSTHKVATTVRVQPFLLVTLTCLFLRGVVCLSPLNSVIIDSCRRVFGYSIAESCAH